jgi:TRAP-type C4-dicarboxylate transport system permease small subunit
VVIVLVLFPEIPRWIGEYLLIVCGALMLLAFILYGRRYQELQEEYSSHGSKSGESGS